MKRSASTVWSRADSAFADTSDTLRTIDSTCPVVTAGMRTSSGSAEALADADGSAPVISRSGQVALVHEESPSVPTSTTGMTAAIRSAASGHTPAGRKRITAS